MFKATYIFNCTKKFWQTDVAKNQCKGLNKIFSSSEDNKDVNESIIKEEALAKSMTNKKYNK